MKPIFIFIRCRPGTAYDVAAALALREMHSELYSISGAYDLLMKAYVPEGEDIGIFVNAAVADVPDIERTETTLTFNAFHPDAGRIHQKK